MKYLAGHRLVVLLIPRSKDCSVQPFHFSKIRHDDYDYSLINELLPKRLKNYIKTVSCYPERCTEQEYQSIMLDFFSSEKVHVCLLICEARLQSSLLYAYKAIHDYYKGK